MWLRKGSVRISLCFRSKKEMGSEREHEIAPGEDDISFDRGLVPFSLGRIAADPLGTGSNQ
jgi:hypothetical protein